SLSAVTISQTKGTTKMMEKTTSAAMVAMVPRRRRRRASRRGVTRSPTRMARLMSASFPRADFVVDPPGAGAEDHQGDQQNDREQHPAHRGTIAKLLVCEELLVDVDHVQVVAARDRDGPARRSGRQQQRLDQRLQRGDHAGDNLEERD